MAKKYLKKRTVYKVAYKKKSYPKASLKKQLLRLHEVKENTYEVGTNQMTHQTYYQFSPTQRIVPGNTSQTRVGDEVYLQSLQLSGFFASSAAPNAAQKMRIQVFWHTKRVERPTFDVNGITGTDLFHTGTFTIVNNGIVNSNAVTMLADMVIDINQVISAAREVKSFAVTVPINKTYKYATEGGSYGKSKQLYVSITGFIENGENSTTNCGYFSLASVLKFKDP